jgi:hypothetical protein
MKNIILNSNSKITDCSVTSHQGDYEVTIYYNYVLDNETEVNKGQQYFIGTNIILKEINKYLNKRHKHLTILTVNEPLPINEPEEEIIGTTGPIVDLFNKELTDEEWKAIEVVHNLKNRLNLGIRFDWSKSIDVRSEECSQIVDESVFNNRIKI